MIPYRVIGVALLAVGIVLLLFGYNATDSVTERVHEGFTGRYTDATMNYIIGGVAALGGGLGLLLWGGRK